MLLSRRYRNAIILHLRVGLVVGSQVAQGLMVVVHAARLLGTEVLLVGIRPEVAQAIVALGLNMLELRTYNDLQNALSRRSMNDTRNDARFSRN